MAADTRPRFILLVPPPPQEHTLLSYKDAFGKSIADVLKELATHAGSGQGAVVLEIALACPQLVGHLKSPRAGLYDGVQKQIALIYKLVVVIANRDHIDVEDADGIDVRVVPVAWDPEDRLKAGDTTAYGPVVTLSTLARSGRSWQYGFGVETEVGESMLKDFVAAKSGVESAPSAPPITSEHSSGPWHHDVAVGGTFDHLHIGHKLLLTMTLFTVDLLDNGGPPSVTVGITGDELLKNKKHAEVLESWEVRQQKIEDFCDGLLDFTSWPAHKAIDNRNNPGPNGRSVNVVYGNGLEVRCTQIQDPFGPTITDKAISALVISAETRAGGKAVNEKRLEKGWPELQVFEVEVLDAEEDGIEQAGFESKLSSTAIRQKLASKHG